jgi:hypothetical protein
MIASLSRPESDNASCETFLRTLKQEAISSHGTSHIGDREPKLGVSGALLRVPAVYLTWANPLFLSSLAFSRISKLRGITRAQNSDSPRLHHTK